MLRGILKGKYESKKPSLANKQGKNSSSFRSATVDRNESAITHKVSLFDTSATDRERRDLNVCLHPTRPMTAR